ncbi:MAG TPA: hypothetical protein DER05_11605 [Lutibacter sp.]|nr:hypothetical protein [Lutibacter sp.]
MKYGSYYAAVEHQSNDDNKLALLVLKKEKNEFKVETQKKLSSIKEVAETLNKNQHLYLAVNNNQVLSKSVKKELNEDKALQNGYSTIKISDFYYEIVQLEDCTHISICRKEYIQKLIDDYKQQHLNIIGFTLGNSAVIHLLPFLESTSISTSNASLAIANNLISSIDLIDKVDEHPYLINGIEILNNYTLSLAAIISYYSNGIKTASNFNSYNTLISKEFAQKRFFSLGLKTGLAVLFISLLVNFLLFDYYNGHNETLIQNSQINQSYKEQLLLLNNELNNKKKLVDDIANSTTSKTSFYFDQIGMSVPTTISLNSIGYQPVLKKIEDGKKIVLSEQTLLIKGSSSNGENFSNWVKGLEKFDWIKSVDIVDYGTGKKLGTMFELRIALK